MRLSAWWLPNRRMADAVKGGEAARYYPLPQTTAAAQIRGQLLQLSGWNADVSLFWFGNMVTVRPLKSPQ